MSPKRLSGAKKGSESTKKTKNPSSEPIPSPKSTPKPKKQVPKVENPPEITEKVPDEVLMEEIFDEETGEWIMAPVLPKKEPPTSAESTPKGPARPVYDFTSKKPQNVPLKPGIGLGQRPDGTPGVFDLPNPVKEEDQPPPPELTPGGDKEKVFEVVERTELQREKDMARIAKLERRGWSVTDISEEMKLDPRTVMADLRQIRKRFHLQILHRKSAMVKEKLAQLREVRKEAWDAWELSKETFIKELTEEYVYTYGDGNTKNVERRQKSKERRLPGNEFLTTILKCLAQERELLGLDAPKKLDVQSMNLNWDVLLGDMTKSGVNLGNLPVINANVNPPLPYQQAGAIMPAIGPAVVVDLVEEHIRQLQEETNRVHTAKTGGLE